jgi:transposase
MESVGTVTIPDRSRLSERQYLAIEVLLTGGTHRECAEAAGVSRTTVTGWVNHHVPFITEIEQRRQQRS